MPLVAILYLKESFSKSELLGNRVVNGGTVLEIDLIECV